MLDEYYTERGWNLETGIPTRETLRKLGLQGI
jgi:aldehyde:ferredoxin oxidoreductase